MFKSLREQQLELENKLLKSENKKLEAEKKTFKEQLQIQIEKYNDLEKENKTLIYKNKYELEKQQHKYTIQKYTKQIEELNTTIVNLKSSLLKDSSNSSIPSSAQNTYKKEKCINTSRKKTERKIGGQPGHKGAGLSKEKFDELVKSGKAEHVIIEHVLNGANVNTSKCIIKYEIDVEIKTRLIEHRFYVKESSNEIPEQYNTEVQYGNNLKAFVAIVSNEGFVALNRLTKIISEITNKTINLSQGTIVNWTRALAVNSSSIIANIKEALIKSGVLHCDESGVRVKGDLRWLHTATTELFTYYQIENKRGKDGIENLGILEYFVGILVHDHFKSYYKYTAITHAECNAHILRYLKFVVEIFNREGATKLLEFFVSINNEKKELTKLGKQAFSNERIQEIENEYTRILLDWKDEYNKYVKGKRITKSLTEERNLFDRLLKYKESHLLFIKNFDVPFDNNVAERAIRMIKTKLKVSGCFRGKDNGNNFATIRSLFETTKKHGMNLYDTVKKIFDNDEIIFEKQ